MVKIKAKIISHQIIKGDYRRLVIRSPKIAKRALPGQFLQVKISNGDDILLRRPFSIHRVKGQDIEILYEVLGKGTELLSGKKRGGYLDIIGPLGNNFEGTPGILVAGGLGVAPLLFLGERLRKSPTLVLIGATTKNQILCEKEFKKLGFDVKIATDDGSAGFKGKVTDLLKKFLPLAIYACGPRPMLKEISRLSQEYKVPAQVSLEEHMACGIGACLGCVVKTRDGYKRVCKEGPVFNAKEIIW